MKLWSNQVKLPALPQISNKQHNQRTTNWMGVKNHSLGNEYQLKLELYLHIYNQIISTLIITEETKTSPLK